MLLLPLQGWLRPPCAPQPACTPHAQTRTHSCPTPTPLLLQPVEDANPVVLGRLVTDPAKPTICFYGGPARAPRAALVCTMNSSLAAC